MDRKKKLFLNTVVSLLNQIIVLICGFVLPRFFLKSYGSDVNGLVSSITQFLGFISLAELGVGAVVQSTLYKPLADKNELEISKIIISAESFFRKIALILVGYSVVLMTFYPFVASKSFGYWYTSSLILVIAISSFAQYFFSISYKLLLNADQMAFIQLGLQSVTLILNTIVSVVLMKNNVSVQLVKLTTSVIFMIQPIALTYYVKKHYKLDKSIKLTEEPIKQKWNGLAQHIAAVVLSNTDVVVLTFFSTLANVSIFSIYFLVVNGIKLMVTSLTTGMSSLLGNMLAKNELKQLNSTFSNLEWMLHTVSTLLFTCAGILIVPFVKVYTLGVHDANYLLPIFGYLMAVSQATYCLRLPYNMMVLAAGHFRQTQLSAIIEAIINLVLSILFVKNFGLIGVTIGTMVAMIYRTVYLANYLSKNIIYRSIYIYIKHVAVDIFSALLIYFATKNFEMLNVSYQSWLFLAIKVGTIALIISLVLNLLFFNKQTKNFIQRKSIK